MHAHGVEVFDRADDDDVVLSVAHHLQLVLFPSEHRFFDQALMHGREIEAAGEHFHQLFAVVGDAAAGAAERKRGTNDDREPDLAGELDAIFQVVDERRLRHIQPDALHRVFEKQTVFRLLDGADLRAYQSDVVLIEHAAVGQFDGEVERRLSSNGGQNGKTRAGRHLPLDANDLFKILACERLDVCAVGRLGIGHDGGRVRVRQHNFKALRLERLASLRAGVVELGRLSDDDGSGAEDQDFRDVSSFGH